MADPLWTDEAGAALRSKVCLLFCKSAYCGSVLPGEPGSPPALRPCPPCHPRVTPATAPLCQSPRSLGEALRPERAEAAAPRAPQPARAPKRGC